LGFIDEYRELSEAQTDVILPGDNDHRRFLQCNGAEKFARASPDNLNAKTKQDESGETDKNIGTRAPKDTFDAI
jgi:hypothetical protein